MQTTLLFDFLLVSSGVLLGFGLGLLFSPRLDKSTRRKIYLRGYANGSMSKDHVIRMQAERIRRLENNPHV